MVNFWIISIVLMQAMCLMADPEKPTLHLGERILNGNTKMEPVKYQAALYHSGNFICGGTVIRPRIVLTTAFCLHKPNVKNYTLRRVEDLHVHAGSNKLLGILNVQTKALISVEKSIPHIKYDPYEFDRRPNDKMNDIGILVTHVNMFNSIADKIQPIRLIDSKHKSVYSHENNIPLTMFGYGLTKSRFTNGRVTEGWNDLSLELQYLEVKVDEVTKTIKEKINKDVFCASAAEKDGVERGASNGDAGGPVVMYDKDINKPILVGIIRGAFSFTRTKVIETTITNILKHDKWIDQTIAEALGIRSGISKLLRGKKNASK